MKKFWRFFISTAMLMCLTVFLLTGCSGEADKEKEDEQRKEEVQKTEEEELKDQNEQQNDQADPEDQMTDEPADTARQVSVYYVDDQTAEIVSKSVEVHNEYDIWNALKDNGILTDDCELLSLTVNEEEKKMDLDFNSAVGDRVRSMGTTGETEIVGCIINTYLEAYGCEGIRLTEEGQAFVTSHGADLDGYSGKVTF